ncbi:serine/threonine-protein kinase [Streptomyces sp. NPDC048420]|uniref:serine/threonine-protein kinase n=1 Tax=Streptomyces sp. NPDC048420 TaxID=3155755 RepID=UPI00341E2183
MEDRGGAALGGRERVIDGRYRVVDMLGRGGMGTVYEAEDEQLGRRVAVKLLTAVEGVGRDNEAWSRFVREARALARIDHPGVVTLYDSGVHEPGGTPYLVMQLLEGISLAELMSAGAGPLPPSEACAVALGIADSLAAAHEAGVLHRDIKPSNVGLTRDGRVVLQDFGLARLAGETTITRTGVVMGTPQFMAPEVMRGALPGPAADLYGLGTCLYLMLSGELPFRSAVDVGAIIERALGTGVPRIAAGAPFPVELGQLVNRLCRQKPEERPQDLGEVRRLLEQLADGGTAALVRRLALTVRDSAVQATRKPVPLVDDELPEYEWDEPESQALALPRPGALDGATLSDATRRIVLGSMTETNALSRQREAVNLVQRGQLREAAQMLSAVVPVCLSKLGPDHPTTLTSQYWQAVCLARLGAGGEALDLFSRVNKRLGRRTDGTDD